MNTITIVGNLVKDVEFKYLENGTRIANFVIADNGYRNGEKTVKYWHCVMFGSQAEDFGNSFTKGREYTIKGEVQDSVYEKDGVKHFFSQIVAQGIKYGRKPKSLRDSSNKEYSE